MTFSIRHHYISRNTADLLWIRAAVDRYRMYSLYNDVGGREVVARLCKLKF